MVLLWDRVGSDLINFLANFEQELLQRKARIHGYTNLRLDGVATLSFFLDRYFIPQLRKKK